MKPFLLITSLFLSLHINLFGQSGQIRAKRAAPKEVQDIPYENIILQRSGMECVQALDSSTKIVLWEQKIYDVIYIPGMETDVQDVFIDSMYLRNKQLMIRNEKREWFDLDLQTRKVKRI